MRKLVLLSIVTVSLFAWMSEKELRYSEGKGDFLNAMYSDKEMANYSGLDVAYSINPELTDKYVSKRNERLKHQHRYEILETELKVKPQKRTKENLAKLDKMAKKLKRLKQEEAILKEKIDEIERKERKQRLGVE